MDIYEEIVSLRRSGRKGGAGDDHECARIHSFVSDSQDAGP